MVGFQIGAYNFAKEGFGCMQFASYNELDVAKYVSQVGFWNEIDDENSSNCLQLGLINKTKNSNFQLGLLNFSEKGFFKFFPFINF